MRPTIDSFRTLTASALAIFSLALSLDGSAWAQCTSAPPGLVAWWPGDCDAADIANHYNGRPFNGAFSPGVVGQAFHFDGVDDYVSVPDQPGLRLASALTIEAWIQTNDTTRSQLIVNKTRCVSSGQGYSLRLRLVSGQLHLECVFYDIGTCSSGIGSVRTVAPAITDNAFHHVAVTYTGGSAPDAKLYVDGVEVPSTVDALPTSINKGKNPLIIGSGEFGSGAFYWFFDGRLDEVGLYDRALSAAEIQAAFQAGSDGKCKPDFDGDGVTDNCDNCGRTPNPGQEDSNGNGIGDVCESFAEGDIYLYGPPSWAQLNGPSGLTRVDPVTGYMADFIPAPCGMYPELAYDPCRDRLVARCGNSGSNLLLIDAQGNWSNLSFTWPSAQIFEIARWAATGDGRIYMFTSGYGFVGYVDACNQAHDLLDTDGVTPINLTDVSGFFGTAREDLIYDVGTNSLFVTHVQNGNTGPTTIVKLPLSADGSRLREPPVVTTINSFAPTPDYPFGLSAGPDGTLFVKTRPESAIQGLRMFTVDPVTLAFEPFASPDPMLGTNGGTYNNTYGYAVAFQGLVAKYLRTYSRCADIDSDGECDATEAGEILASWPGGYWFGTEEVISIGDTINGTPGTCQPCAGSNQPPVADAGQDQTVDEGTPTTLDGSLSSDPEGDPLSYVWVQLAGPSVVVDLTDPVHPTFFAPSVPVGGATLTFQLTVHDGLVDSEPATVNVTVKNFNHPPVAEAGPDLIVAEGSLIGLDGSDSFDQDGDPLTFSWVQTSGPAVSLSGAATVRPTFAAPLVGSGGAVLTFDLTVDDGSLDSVDSVDVIVENVNHAPVADAGPDQTRDEGALVQLNGTGSSDPDGDPITYSWVQTGGPAVVLSDPSGVAPTFVAPEVVATQSVALTFQLMVADGLGGFGFDDVVVTVLDTNAPPVCAQAQPSEPFLWPPNHKLIPVKIVGVSDPDDEGVTITVLSVTQDEPLNGLGDGDTSPDAVIQGDTVLLRAERQGGGNGRVYRITFQADDGVGGVCTGSVAVCVPHDKGQGFSCIDDGQLFDSLAP